jgi:DNA-directed RNA polymerase specialized sigma24 family protein
MSSAGRPSRPATLFYLQDLPVDDVAEAMGTSTGTAKAHLSRGRDRLRELLDD